MTKLLLLGPKLEIFTTSIEYTSGINSNVADIQMQKYKEDIWHRRFGHLRERSLQKLAKEKLVDGFNFDSSREISYCQPYIVGKLHI